MKGGMNKRAAIVEVFRNAPQMPATLLARFGRSVPAYRTAKHVEPPDGLLPDGPRPDLVTLLLDDEQKPIFAMVTMIVGRVDEAAVKRWPAVHADVQDWLGVPTDFFTYATTDAASRRINHLLAGLTFRKYPAE